MDGPSGFMDPSGPDYNPTRGNNSSSSSNSVPNRTASHTNANGIELPSDSLTKSSKAISSSDSSSRAKSNPGLNEAHRSNAVADQHTSGQGSRGIAELSVGVSAMQADAPAGAVEAPRMDMQAGGNPLPGSNEDLDDILHEDLIPINAPAPHISQNTNDRPQQIDGMQHSKQTSAASSSSALNYVTALGTGKFAGSGVSSGPANGAHQAGNSMPSAPAASPGKRRSMLHAQTLRGLASSRFV